MLTVIFSCCCLFADVRKKCNWLESLLVEHVDYLHTEIIGKLFFVSTIIDSISNQHVVCLQLFLVVVFADMRKNVINNLLISFRLA
jgi:hypothetical protein